MPYVADERAMLTAFLDAMRLAVRRKLDGVSVEQARSTPTVSSLSLLGIVKHLAWTERRWFRASFAGEQHRFSIDGDSATEFWAGPDDTIESVVRLYEEECARAREITAAASSLEQLTANRQFASPVSLRWILVHMIEETARHAGHADVIRETLDGSVGE